MAATNADAGASNATSSSQNAPTVSLAPNHATSRGIQNSKPHLQYLTARDPKASVEEASSLILLIYPSTTLDSENSN